MNPVIGDTALDFSATPRATMTELDKIRCHLSFAREELLQHTTKDQTRREEILSALKPYIDIGAFPRNENDEASPGERYPCFIDSEGTPCAVAYLMQSSGAATLADTIASSHKYDSIGQIAKDEELLPSIEAWARTVDLELSDLALIQPTYEFVAREARELFREAEGIFLEISSTCTSSTSSLADSEKHRLANLIVRFGDKMISGFGWPRQDIPDYLERLGKLEDSIPDTHPKEVRELLNLLRKETEGSRSRGERPKAEDYDGLLSPEDLEFMKHSDIGNCRVKRQK